jgi:ferrous iron transport protein A
MTLAELAPGQTAHIASVQGRGSFRRRLLELGLVAGTPITRQGSAPLGDPLTYRVRGAILALRARDAARVVLTSDHP